MLQTLRDIYDTLSALRGDYVPIDPSIIGAYSDTSYTLPDFSDFAKSLKTCYQLRLQNILLSYFSTDAELTRFEIRKLQKCVSRAHVLTRVRTCARDTHFCNFLISKRVSSASVEKYDSSMFWRRSW